MNGWMGLTLFMSIKVKSWISQVRWRTSRLLLCSGHKDLNQCSNSMHEVEDCVLHNFLFCCYDSLQRKLSVLSTTMLDWFTFWPFEKKKPYLLALWMLVIIGYWFKPRLIHLFQIWQVEHKAGRRGREWATLGVHPLSWLLSNNRLEKVPFVSVPHTSSNRLLLSNQDKGCTPSVAHFLALPLGPALLNLWNVICRRLCVMIISISGSYEETRASRPTTIILVIFLSAFCQQILIHYIVLPFLYKENKVILRLFHFFIYVKLQWHAWWGL